MRKLDEYFEAHIHLAHESGELGGAYHAGIGTLHTIAIRARVGMRRGELEELARNAVSVICA